MIAATEAILGKIPRKFDFWTKHVYLKTFASSTLKNHRPELMVIYDNWRLLLEHGKVALAVVVQANIRLFEEGRHNHPANVVYSAQPDAERRLPELFAIVEQLGYLKNQDFLLNEDEEYFSGLVADEMKSAFDVPLPKSLNRGVEAYFTTLMIHRKHLPTNRLSQFFFPVLIHPDTDASMIVPSRFWSEDILALWRRNGYLKFS